MALVGARITHETLAAKQQAAKSQTTLPVACPCNQVKRGVRRGGGLFIATVKAGLWSEKTALVATFYQMPYERTLEAVGQSA